MVECRDLTDREREDNEGLWLTYSNSVEEQHDIESPFNW